MTSSSAPLTDPEPFAPGLCVLCLDDAVQGRQFCEGCGVATDWGLRMDDYGEVTEGE